MAQPTNEDLTNAQLFSAPNILIRQIQLAHSKNPWLISHLKITKRPATNKDYYIPKSLRDSSYVVKAEITEELCKMLSCNNIRERDTCQPETPASYYRVGDNAFDVQCQPACFNISTDVNKNFNLKGERIPDSTMLNWHQNECRFVDTATIAWLEKTFYRSKILYEKRKNDMPTGFSRIKSTNPYGCGFDYVPNETYCNYYDRTLQPDLSCNMTVWEKVLDSVIGMSLINFGRSVLRTFQHGKPFDIPQNLPEFPNELPEMYRSVDNWKSNINKDFQIPEVINIKPNFRLRRTRRDISNHEADDDDDDNDLNEHISEFTQLQMGIKTLKDYEWERVNKLQAEANERLQKFKERNNRCDIIEEQVTRVKRQINDIINNEHGFKEKIKDHKYGKKSNGGKRQKIKEPLPPSEVQESKYITIIRNLLQYFTTDEFFKQLGYDVVQQELLKQTKSLCNKIIQKLLNDAFQKTATTIVGRIGEKVLGAGIKATFNRMVVGSVVRYASQSVIFAAKFAASITSVIGIILIFTAILDLVFTFWDPFGYQNLFPPTIVQDLMANSELAFRRSFKSATASYTIDNLLSKLLTEDEILEIQLQSLIESIIYLDALSVNSEGSRINKGEQIDLRDLNPANIESGITQTVAKEIVRWNEDSYNTYNRPFLNRINLTRNCNAIAVVLFTLSGLMFIIGLILLALVLFILALTILIIARLNISSDLFVNGYNEYTTPSTPSSSSS